MSEDGKFVLFFILGVIGVVALVISLISLVNAGANVDDWTESTNDCYVHTYEDNRLFGNDSGTIITELCPVE